MLGKNDPQDITINLLGMIYELKNASKITPQ